MNDPVIPHHYHATAYRHTGPSRTKLEPVGERYIQARRDPQLVARAALAHVIKGRGLYTVKLRPCRASELGMIELPETTR